MSPRWLLLVGSMAWNLALSQPGPADDPDYPTQVHIAQGRFPTEMSISWVTKGPAESVVRYGAAPNYGLDSVTYGTASNYTFVWQNHTYDSPQLHVAYLTDLKPATQYIYKIGSLPKADVNSFVTLPRVGDMTKVLDFAVIGDLGTTADSEKTIQAIARLKIYDMILHVGDLAYANNVHKIWDDYGDMCEVLASNTPWMVGAGNHEIERGWEEGTGPNATMFMAFEARYNMPRVAPARHGKVTHKSQYPTGCCPSDFQVEYDYGNSFFSFEQGMTHIINLNPYTPSHQGSPQYKWVLEDLARVDRALTPWIIVMMHGPWYNSNVDHQHEFMTEQMKSALEGAFRKYQVAMVFSGHVHAYERSYPVYKNKVDMKKGVTFINIGDGGNAEGHARKFVQNPEEWSAFRDGYHYGHGGLKIHNSTHLHWKWEGNEDGRKVWYDNKWVCNPYFVNADCSATKKPHLHEML